MAERGTGVGDSKFLAILDNGILLGARGQMADVCHLFLRRACAIDDERWFNDQGIKRPAEFTKYPGNLH